MESGITRRKFRVIEGGKKDGVEPEGPINRLGLWTNFKPLSTKHILWLFIPKVTLLAMVLYAIYHFSGN